MVTALQCYNAESKNLLPPIYSNPEQTNDRETKENLAVKLKFSLFDFVHVSEIGLIVDSQVSLPSPTLL